MLSLPEWKALQAKLDAPPSEALRRFMTTTPTVVSEELMERVIRAQIAHESIDSRKT
jgi:hypothetical protein